MKIDFSTFAESKTVVVPVRNNTCRYNRKFYKVTAPDGWWKVSLCGNNAVVETQVDITSEISTAFKKFKGYTYNNQFLFKSFDIARRYFNNQVMMPFYFGANIETFNSISVLVGEDESLYFYSIDYEDMFIYDIVDRFNSKQTIESFKGATPELKTLYMFHMVEREAHEKALEEIKKKKALAEFASTLEGRLALTFKLTGAELISYKASKDKVTVVWQNPHSAYEFNSVLDAKTLQVVEAGYCMSGHDKEHSASSMVMLARDYEQRDVIHKTRF